jgi:DNA-binding transcriptional LysR family regulator
MTSHALLDTNQLHTFVILAESNSITEAAQKLKVTQPAISQCLRQLESQLGTELIVRRKKPVQLTMAGRALKQKADVIIGELTRLNDLVRDASNQRALQCRLGLVTSCSEVFGSLLITELCESTEQIMLKSGNTSTLVEQLLNRDIDILVSDDPLLELDAYSQWELFRDPLVIAVPESYLKTLAFDAKGRVNVHTLAKNKPLIKFGKNTSIGTLSELALRRMNLMTDVRFETDDTHTLMNFVRDGHGWGILSSLCVAQSIHSLDQVHLFELDSSRHARTLYLVYLGSEMGSIPAKIEASIKQILVESVIPKIQKKSPWFSCHTFDVVE